MQALAGIDIDIEQGDFVSLIGPSGCGKTTLLRVIADLERATSGRIRINGAAPAEARLARAHGYVFQAAALFPWRNIADNVALPLEIMGVARPGRIHEIIHSDLPDERHLDMRESKAFLKLANRVREELRAGHGYDVVT